MEGGKKNIDEKYTGTEGGKTKRNPKVLTAPKQEKKRILVVGPQRSR